MHTELCVLKFKEHGTRLRDEVDKSSKYIEVIEREKKQTTTTRRFEFPYRQVLNPLFGKDERAQTRNVEMRNHLRFYRKRVRHFVPLKSRFC